MRLRGAAACASASVDGCRPRERRQRLPVRDHLDHFVPYRGGIRARRLQQAQCRLRMHDEVLHGVAHRPQRRIGDRGQRGVVMVVALDRFDVEFAPAFAQARRRAQVDVN